MSRDKLKEPRIYVFAAILTRPLHNPHMSSVHGSSFAHDKPNRPHAVAVGLANKATYFHASTFISLRSTQPLVRVFG